MAIDRVDFDLEVNRLENFLSNVSPYPIVGTLAGSIKIILGAAQFTIAMIAVIVTGIAYIFTRNFGHVKYTFSHVTHGLGNIMAGFLELIPGIQTIFYKIRIARQTAADGLPQHLYSGHETKWMPYSSLTQVEWFIGTNRQPNYDLTKGLAIILRAPDHHHPANAPAKAALLAAPQSFSALKHYAETFFLPIAEA